MTTKEHIISHMKGVVGSHEHQAKSAIRALEYLQAECPFCHGHAIGDECERCSRLAETAYHLRGEANVEWNSTLGRMIVEKHELHHGPWGGVPELPEEE